MLLSEEERESHLHILGTTGEGKSRLIEHLIRGDIKQGNGVCFLDPTDRAETAYNILRWCAQEGFEKVILIDPHLLRSHNRLPCIQPFHYNKSYKDASVANLMETMRVLFDMKDMAHFSFIQQYLPALLRVLWNAEATTHEAKYFTKYGNRTYRSFRDSILFHSDPLDDDRITIEEAFSSPSRFVDFGSTARRLLPLFHTQLDLMLGTDSGIDFPKMITEGWVILVNLYSGFGFEPIHTRLLGTTVINELIFALDRLRNRGWRGVYYLYIDEAGRYANRNLADLLAYKRKSGLRVTIAHQYFNQFEDRTVLDAVKQLCKYKVMFDTPNPHDRLEMIRLLGYGGEIPPSVAQYANQNLPKQNAIVKPAKGTPVRIKVADVPDAKIGRKAEDEFIFKILNQPWYMHPDDIRAQMEKRFYDAKPPVRPTPPRKGATTNRPPVGDTKKPRPKTIFDD